MLATEEIQRLPVFRDCSRKSIDRFRTSAPPVEFAAGSVLLRQGDAALGAFLVVTGRCRVELEANGKTSVIGHIGPGEVAGELGLFLRDARRSATVVAEEPVQALVLSADLLRQADLVEPMSRVERRAMATLAERVRSSTGAYRRNAEREVQGNAEPTGIIAKLRSLWGN